jgi:multiple sugar transport system substrate-binding protein
MTRPLTNEFPSVIRLHLLLFSAVAVAVIMLLLRFAHKDLTIAIHEGVEGIALKEIAQDFAQERNRPVTIIELPYDQLYDREFEQLGQESSRYDVIMVDDPWMEALAEREGTQKGLDPVKFPKNECNLADFVPALLRVSRVPYEQDGEVQCGKTIYGLPFVGNTQLFAYRGGPDQAPRDWHQVINEGYVMRTGPGNRIVTDFMPVLWGFSRESLPTAPNEKKPPLPKSALMAFEYLERLGQRAQANLSIVSYDDFDVTIHVAKIKPSTAIMWSAWVMAINRLEEPYHSDVLRDLQFAMVPGGQPELGTWLLAVPANSNNKDEAHSFVHFATSRKQILKAAKYGNPPPLQGILEDPELQKTVRFQETFIKTQRESLNQARPRPRTKYWRNVERALGRCLSALYESTITPQESLERANAVIEQEMSGRPADGFTCKKP